MSDTVSTSQKAPPAKRACTGNAFKLYGYWRSSASWRVRIALNLKGLKYDYIPVNLVKGEQASDENKARNPIGAVPSLEISDGTILTQSLPIIEFINELHPEANLLPADPVLRAKVRAVAEIVNSNIQPLQNLKVIVKIEKLTGSADTRKEWAAAAIRDGLEALEKLAAKSAGKCFFGDEITLADVCLVPQLYNAHRFGVDVTPFPTLIRINDHLATVDAFAAAHPDKQPDADVPALAPAPAAAAEEKKD